MIEEATVDAYGEYEQAASWLTDPSIAARGEGFRVLPMEVLVELKLASGTTNPDRLKDLADVQELIRHARLPLELSAALDESVRAKYVEIWNATSKSVDDDEEPTPRAE